MIVVNLMGGMGNQMFQYAMGKRLSIETGQELFLDHRFLINRDRASDFTYRDYYLDVFNIDVNTFNGWYPPESLVRVLSRVKMSVFGVTVQRKFESDRKILESTGNSYYSGYWQSPKYFSDIEGMLKVDFTFKYPLSDKSSILAEKINSVDSVCLNIRRSDYVDHGLHDVCGLDYYIKSISYFDKEIPEPFYFVFSDDIEWCKSNIGVDRSNIFYVDHTYAHGQNGGIFDEYLHLMTLCSNFIIPNSTFAWWAVWLNNNKNKKVVAPSKWFNNKEINASELYSNKWKLL